MKDSHTPSIKLKDGFILSQELDELLYLFYIFC